MSASSSHDAPESGAPPVEGIPDMSEWHAVSPLSDCPHTPSVVVSDSMCVDLKSPCGVCGNVGENMMCLACHEVHCGRHVLQHMVAHHEATAHPIVCGFIDLSFWCYPCESYIDPANARLHPVYAALHTAKFGSPPPTSSAKIVGEG
eukprot:Sspe_Gene.118515::Locus_112155_Transcript_2_3_Confidence_0.500_Length_555::g.118515::m.118515